MRKGIGGHQLAFRGRSDSWITPKAVIDRLGPFDLDPCQATPQPWPCAARAFTEADDGLTQPWEGFVYLNPPYGPQTTAWMKRLAQHPGGGIALIFARTETETWVRWVWPYTSGVVFISGRLFFYTPEGQRAPFNSGGPSALVGYGAEAARWLRTYNPGVFVVPERAT